MDQQARLLRSVTAGLLAVSASVLLVWDVYVGTNELSDDTISELLRDLSHDFYSLPFILMICMGHFFWNRPPTNMPSKEVRVRMFWFGVVGSSIAVILRDVVNAFVTLPVIDHANLVVGVVGFFVGAVLWPQASATSRNDAEA